MPSRLSLAFIVLLGLAACAPSTPQAVTPEIPAYSLTLPAGYEPLQDIAKEERKTQTDIENNMLIFRSAIQSLRTQSSEGDFLAGRPQVTVNVFPLKGYSFTDTPSGIEFTYDNAERTWTYDYPGHKIPTIERNGWKGYHLESGDAGGYLGVVAIPVEEKGVMLELGFLSYVDPSDDQESQTVSTENFRKAEEAIIASLQIGN